MSLAWIAPCAKDFKRCVASSEVGSALFFPDQVDVKLLRSDTRTIVVSAQPVKAAFLSNWAATATTGGLLLIRRGTSLGSIDLQAAKKLGITVINTPGVNSPHVAKFAVERLQLLPPHQHKGAKDAKVVIIGAGTVGKVAVSLLNSVGIVPTLLTETSMKMTSSSSSATELEKLLQTRYGLTSGTQAVLSHSMQDSLLGATHVLVCCALSGTEPLISEQAIQGLLSQANPDGKKVHFCCISRPEVLSFAAIRLLAQECRLGGKVGRCTFDYGPTIIKPLEKKVLASLPPLPTSMVEDRKGDQNPDPAADCRAEWTSQAMNSEECKRDMDLAVVKYVNLYQRLPTKFHVSGEQSSKL